MNILEFSFNFFDMLSAEFFVLVNTKRESPKRQTWFCIQSEKSTFCLGLGLYFFYYLEKSDFHVAVLALRLTAARAQSTFDDHVSLLASFFLGTMWLWICLGWSEAAGGGSRNASCGLSSGANSTLDECLAQLQPLLADNKVTGLPKSKQDVDTICAWVQKYLIIVKKNEKSLDT